MLNIYIIYDGVGIFCGSILFLFFIIFYVINILNIQNIINHWNCLRFHSLASLFVVSSFKKEWYLKIYINLWHKNEAKIH